MAEQSRAEENTMRQDSREERGRTDKHILLVCLHQATSVVHGVGHIGALLRQYLVAVEHLLGNGQVLQQTSM